MQPLVPNTDDLISLLDRVLDKGIVLDKWACLSLQESGLTPADSGIPSDYRITVASSAVFVGYGKRGTWREDLELDDLFPSGIATSGANSFRMPARNCENRTVDF
jgi:hypothetical protein